MVGILPLIMVTLLTAMTAQLSTMLARQSLVMGGVNGARQDLDALAQAKQALLDFVIAQGGTGQMLSLPMVALGIALLALAYSRKNDEARNRP